MIFRGCFQQGIDQQAPLPLRVARGPIEQLIEKVPDTLQRRPVVAQRLVDKPCSAVG
jgi:hypothetical protein